MKIISDQSVTDHLKLEVEFSPEEVKNILAAAAYRAHSHQKPEGDVLYRHPFYQVMKEVEQNVEVSVDPSGAAVVNADIRVFDRKPAPEPTPA